ncbi:hypothetical protein HBN54_000700 [Hymenobacter sp. 1B]|uniref:Uncharacterized protein n=1 Tax=Hymenobacter artigasi TaxID=2719616 RepID=A0ABX1HGF3_9BACT|nr:hypothetical protein [Hymenobacter artigasi]
MFPIANTVGNTKVVYKIREPEDSEAKSTKIRAIRDY